MKRINWILVPIDFSEESRLALETADAEAAQWKSGLILLHVKKPHEPVRTRLAIEEGGLDKWGRWIKQTSSDRVAYMTCTGDPAKEILNIAAEYKPRKIIMGRGGNKLHCGSVAKAVGAGFRGIVEAVSGSRDDVFIHAAVA